MLNFSISGNFGKISSSFSWWWLVPCHAMSTTSSGSDISSLKSDGPSSVINLKKAPWSLLYEIAKARPSGLQQIPVILAFGKFSNLSNFQTRSNFSNRWRNSSPSSEAQHTVSLFVLEIVVRARWTDSGSHQVVKVGFCDGRSEKVSYLIAIFIIFTPYVCSTANLMKSFWLFVRRTRGQRVLGHLSRKGSTDQNLLVSDRALRSWS